VPHHLEVPAALSNEQIFATLISADVLLFTMLVAHIYRCYRNERQRGRIMQFLKDRFDVDFDV